MNLDEFDRFRRKVDENGIVFYYTGYLSQNIIGSIGDALRTKLEAEDIKGPAARRIFSTFIEMMQNILNYAEHPDIETDKTGLHIGTIAIGHTGDNFFIVCGNSMAQAHVSRLRDKLEHIQALSLDEIKQEYKRRLREDPEAGSKGAGLGFLTVARDASQPIEFNFHEDARNPGIQHFFLKAII